MRSAVLKGDWGEEDLPERLGYGRVDKITVREIHPADRAWMVALAVRTVGAEIVVSRGRAHLRGGAAGLRRGAERRARRRGAVPFRWRRMRTRHIDTLRQHCGVGTALLQAVIGAAGNRRLWLITTNDNLDAMRFYQRRGFVSPRSIPTPSSKVGAFNRRFRAWGISAFPIRDELEFVRPR